MKVKTKGKRAAAKASLLKVLDFIYHAQWRSLSRVSDQFTSQFHLNASQRSALVALLAHRFSRPMIFENGSIPDCLNGVLGGKTALLVEISVHRLELAKRFLFAGNDYEARASLVLMSAALGEAICLTGFSSDDRIEITLSNIDELLSSLSVQAELWTSIAENKLPRQIVFILGMHRSGTSALAGLLCHSGFTAPRDQLPITDANPKGYWESVSLYSHNEALLKSHGASWHSPDALSAQWQHHPNTKLWRTKLLSIISTVFGNSGIPIIKDPRFCVLIPALTMWLESSDLSVKLLIPIRHPHEVAKSLSIREGISLQQGIHLWMLYTIISLDISRHYHYKLIPFEHLLSASSRVVEDCHVFVGSNLPTSSESEFIDVDFRHHFSPGIANDFKGLAPEDKREEELAVMLYLALIHPDCTDVERLKRFDVIRKAWLRNRPGCHDALPPLVQK